MLGTLILWAQVGSLEWLPLQGGQHVDKSEEGIGDTEVRPCLLPGPNPVRCP